MAFLAPRDHQQKAYVAQDVPKRIKHIQFQPFTPKDIVRVSEVEVTMADMYSNKPAVNNIRETVAHGPLDGRMGPNQKGKKCLTCGEETVKCVGHYGFIKLALPVFHVGYFRPTINMLSCVCKVSTSNPSSIASAEMIRHARVSCLILKNGPTS